MVVQGFSRASLEHGRRLRPLSFPVKLNPGHGEKENEDTVVPAEGSLVADQAAVQDPWLDLQEWRI